MIINWYTDSVTIRRRDIAQDSGGAPLNQYSTIGSYKGHIQQLIGSERFVNEQKEPIDSWRLFLPFNTPIKNRDQILYGGRIFFNKSTHGNNALLLRGIINGINRDVGFS